MHGGWRSLRCHRLLVVYNSQCLPAAADCAPWPPLPSCPCPSRLGGLCAHRLQRKARQRLQRPGGGFANQLGGGWGRGCTQSSRSRLAGSRAAQACFRICRGTASPPLASLRNSSSLSLLPLLRSRGMAWCTLPSHWHCTSSSLRRCRCVARARWAGLPSSSSASRRVLALEISHVARMCRGVGYPMQSPLLPNPLGAPAAACLPAWRAPSPPASHFHARAGDARQDALLS